MKTLMHTILIALFCLPAAFAADWPQWLGPSRNGVSSEVVEPWTESPQVLWRTPVGNGFSVPVVASGMVYVHSAVAGENAEQVTAYDLATGNERWKQPYSRGSYQSQLGVGPRATPTVVDGRLVVFGITGELVCFDAATGEKHWQVNPYREHEVATPGFGVCSSPLIVHDRIIIPIGGAGMAVAAYDIATGKLAWKALDEPASSASPITWQRGAGEQATLDVVVQTTLRIVGMNPENGEVRWEHPLVFQPSGVSPTPLVAGDRLICTTQDTGTLAVGSPSSQAVPGQPAWWDQELSSYFSTGTIGAAGDVFLVTNVLMPLPRTDLVCLDAATGKPHWKQNGLGYFHIGLIATGSNRLLILTDGGKLILAQVDRDGFRELCQAKVCDGTFVNPVLSDGRLIVRDGKELVCLQLEVSK
ncbi:MAG: PQQ-binding-like beta-propeller repeat protein [Betaproteobacteria bacterium]